MPEALPAPGRVHALKPEAQGACKLSHSMVGPAKRQGREEVPQNTWLAPV